MLPMFQSSSFISFNIWKVKFCNLKEYYLVQFIQKQVSLAFFLSGPKKRVSFHLLLPRISNGKTIYSANADLPIVWFIRK